MPATEPHNLHPLFERKIEAWRNLKTGCRVRAVKHPLDTSTTDQTGTFLEYTSHGYARVAFDPKPECKDQSPVLCLVHPESLEVIPAQEVN